MSKRKPRIALALAGGGPLGAIHEIGALCALQEALDGIAFERLDHYVGVSAGGFIAAGLANGMTPRELCAAFVDDPARDGNEHEVFDPAWLMVPAYGEYLRRFAQLPGLIASGIWHSTVRRKPITQALERLGAALPTGIFSNEEVDRRLAGLFSRAGRSNDFRQLRTRLTLVATNLDTGEAAPFGRPGFDHVPISKAVQASSALPGLFPPVEIDDQHYVDGALKKTLHATVVLDEGVDLLLCLNPLVPFHVPGIAHGGLPAVLSQTFRSMIHSRLALGMKHYERAYPGTDIVLLEPDRRDPELYRANTFSYRQRRERAEHAYQQTRAFLRANAATLAPKFARHGITLREDILRQRRRLVAPAAPTRIGEALLVLQDAIDDLERLVEPQPAQA
jgi:NTE family protein